MMMMMIVCVCVCESVSAPAEGGTLGVPGFIMVCAGVACLEVFPEFQGSLSV